MTDRSDLQPMIEQVQWELDLACAEFQRLGRLMDEVAATIRRHQRRLFELGALQGGWVPVPLNTTPS